MAEQSTLAQRLRHTRLLTGKQLAAAARDMGLSQPAVLSRYETGARVPKTQRLLMMANYYGVRFDWLAFGEGNPHE